MAPGALRRERPSGPCGGGTNSFFAVQDGPSLVAKFTEITNVVAECTYTLDK